MSPCSPPSVSVLIPCHNGEHWLAEAIASAVACDGVSQVVVVDDGSSDRSTDIARSFGSNVEVIIQPASGGNAARNRLLEAARGEWVQFLDADDYLEPGKVAQQFREARAQAPIEKADVLYSPVWIETWRVKRLVDRVASPLDCAADLFTQWITWQMPQTGGPLWRASALRKIGGWNEAMSCCQEHELYLRALKAGLRWAFCPTPGAVYRIWSEQTVCRRDPVRVIRTRTALTDDLLGWLTDEGKLTAAHRAAAGQAFFEMARTWARHDIAAAASYFDERKGGAGVQLKGPAAPVPYRLAYQVCGFRLAELLARCLR